MENTDIEIESPIDGRIMNLRFICQFYERLEIESEEDGNRMFSPIRLWYDTTPTSRSVLHQIYVIFAGNESKHIAIFTGFYFNPVEKMNIELFKSISKNTQLYLN